MTHPVTPPVVLPPPIDPDQLALILAEAAAADQRTISDVEGSAPLAAAACGHEAFSARVTRGASWDDHLTQWGQCLHCHQWLVLTEYRTGRAHEFRAMTDRELEAMQAIDDRYRRLEAQ